MNLDEYIKKALIDITKGVIDAKKEAQLAIAPGAIEGDRIVTPEYVTFEIIVSTNKEGSGGIKVLPIGLDGKITHEQYNKISFRVPVYFNASPSK